MKSNIVKQFHAYGWDWYLAEDGRQSWISEPVKKRIEELEAENAKLRQQLADATESMGRVDERCARLRELIADVHDALRADKVGMFHKLILASMEDDMRELGIEVG